MLRTICSVVSVSLLESCDRPLASPKAKPMLPPIRKPTLARQKLTQMLRTSSPDSSSFQPASATSLGAGSTRAGTKPVTLATCQITMMASGTIHWIRPSTRGRLQCADERKAVDQAHDCDACCCGRYSLPMVSPNGPVLTRIGVTLLGCSSDSSGNTSSAKR